MKTFILNYINTALFICLVTSLILILLMRLIIHLSSIYNSDSLEITDDEYFALNNPYNPQKIFYFVTYKLYHNGILNLKMNQGKFYYVPKDTYSLTDIENEVSMLYANGLSPKEFTYKMINENTFKQYFDSLYKNLILKKFIKSPKKLLFDRILFIIGLLIILIPEIMLAVYLEGEFLSKIIINLLLSLFMYVLLLKDVLLTNLTLKGINSNKNFKNTNPYYSQKLKNDNYSNDMDKFLLQNIYMYYFDSELSDDSDDCDDFDE